MNTAVIITLIVCVTIVLLFAMCLIIGTLSMARTAKQTKEIIDKTIDENHNFFEKF